MGPLKPTFLPCGALQLSHVDWFINPINSFFLSIINPILNVYNPPNHRDFVAPGALLWLRGSSLLEHDWKYMF